jgi:membrane associated rhomboid family serine protease/tetratricopeptide (TPR) repeat protein
LGAKVNELIHAGEYWRLVTPLFLHAGILHLALNGISLLVLGAAVERIYGRGRFLVLYLFSGLCGSVASYEFSSGLSVGASGAIFGLAGVIIVFAFRHRQRISTRFRDEVRTVLMPMVILQLVLGFAWPEVVDAMAHLGGFLGGCLLAMLAESPLAGNTAVSRERLPVEIALITGALLVGYAGVSASLNLQRQLPLIRASASRDSEQQIKLLTDAIARQPALVEPRAQLGQLLESRGRWAEAAEQYQQVLRRQPTRRDIVPHLWLSRREAGQTEAAAELLPNVVARDEDLPRLVEFASILARTRHEAASAELLQAIVRRRPGMIEARVPLARLHVAMGQWQAAIEQCREILHRAPQREGVRILLWLALRQSGQPEQAAGALREAFRESRGLENALQLAFLLAQTRQHAAATELCDAILQRFPEHPQALNDVAYTFVDMLDIRYGDAVRMARRAVDAEPKQGAFWDTLGWAYFKNRQLEEAAAAQAQAVRLTPRNGEVRYHMGAIEEARGHRANALREYTTALQYDPQLARARAALARLSRTPTSSTGPVRSPLATPR